MKHYEKVIKRNPKDKFGKPCIRNTNITVYDILSCLSAGMSFEDIIADYPEISNKDIVACLAYSADKENKLQQV
jgi:uncharacterized protein (DUF433 family)